MTPLYIQAKNKTLGTLQLLDQETLDWIKITSASWLESLSNENNFFDTEEVPRITHEQFDLIHILVPKIEYFYSKEHYYSIHGISHILRVMYISAIICNLINEKDHFKEVLLAASIHDIRRINDNEDKGHGGRAYQWFKRNTQEYFTTISITEFDLEIVKQATVFHQIDYENIPSSVYEKYGYFIDVFKAADALDRFRQPKEKWWPNPNYINLKQSISLLKFCNMFTIITEQEILKRSSDQSPVDIIHSIAKQLLKK